MSLATKAAVLGLLAYLPEDVFIRLCLRWHDELSARAGRRPYNLRIRHHGDRRGHRGLLFDAGGEEEV